ncbi:MAG: hypothetical protein EKK42_34680 [Pseudonocardiaceae bacterium]|nr:MAG: hypothetical protein EKK42_34680 [Pseudonocardiaceae bacterium]
MNILAKLLPAKTAITSDSIRAEIVRNESEVASLQTKLARADASIAALDDAEHIKVIEASAATRRAIDRLNAARAHLEAELPLRAAEEEAAAKVAGDEALRQRADACRKATTKEAAKLLADYDKLAIQIGDILARLDEIANETNAVNSALHSNPVAESVTDFNTVHRKHPDRLATERRELRPVYVWGDGTVEPADLDSDGNPKRPEKKWIHHEQRYTTANIEQREIVVARSHFRPGHYENPLSAIHLPPAFAGGKAAWPRS